MDLTNPLSQSGDLTPDKPGKQFGTRSGPTDIDPELSPNHLAL